MKNIQTNKSIMKDYNLDEEELLKIFNECLNYYLSLEELEPFIFEYYTKLEMRLNKKHQK